MKKRQIFILFVLIFFPGLFFSQDIKLSLSESTESYYSQTALYLSDSSSPERTHGRIPFFSTFFHDFGKNYAGSFTYGYGIPWIVGTAGSYALVKTGADWEWNRFNVRHEFISEYVPLAGVSAGTFLPFLIPFTMYFGIDNPDVQLTGLALGQAAFQGFLVSSTVKTITGRVPPHIQDAIDGKSDYQNDYSSDFRWGFYRGGIKDGWPSGHTTVAVAMSTTLATMYPENTAIRLGAIAYSSFVGISMSFRAHWISDVFAGAFAGFGIGRTVGKSFKKLKDGKAAAEEKVSLTYYGNGMGILVRL